jgi:hypothetical protein
MIRNLLIAALLLGTVQTAAAYRVIEAVENAYELSLTNIEMPLSAEGSVNFRTCAGCRTNVRRVTAETRYFLNKRELSYSEFVTAVKDIRARNGADSTLVALFYNLQSELVTRITLHRSID